jgi:PTS system nitrogen regulatory IIA component
MVSLSGMMRAGSVSAWAAAPNKKALFQYLGQVAEREYGLSPGDVIERLHERERLGSTGFGKGVAIPHGKIDGLEHVVAIFARLAQPIDYQAVDDLPVDLVFCLLSPPDAGADHLKALAQASRCLRDSAFVAKLRGAGSDDAVLALFAGQEERHAA